MRPSCCRRALSSTTLVLALAAFGCGGREAPVALRLADLYTAEMVADRAPLPSPPPRTEWRFDGPAPSPPPEKNAATRGWEAFNGVSGLAIRDGRLTGTAGSELPMLHLERDVGRAGAELVHEIEVRLRVSAGTNLGVATSGSEKLDRAYMLDVGRHFEWDFTTPLVAGDELRTYTIRSRFSLPASRTRHIFIRPSDAKGARFEIESVRLVLRSEHLAGVASGLSWQGLSEVYHETLVGRAPETIKLDLELPARPRLDLALGTIEDAPVRFRVSASSGGGEKVLLERTLTRAHRWEDVRIDLSAHAGRKVGLLFSLASERPGALGLWGSPVVRALGRMPRPARKQAKPPQGVILVWADTLRRDHTSVYGYERPTTPHLEQLAREGALFKDCVGQASWTKVATPSLMTSLYPTSHGVRDFFDRLSSSATTLAEVYRAAGYATLSLSSILFTGKFTNLHQGFESVHEPGSLPDAESAKTARDYVDRLVPWLEAHRELPFFVFLHVADPHDPFAPYAPYDTTWADPARRDEHARQGKKLLEVIADPLLRHMGSPMPTLEELKKAGIDPEAYTAYNRDLYDGAIRGMDEEIGRLMEALRGMGLDEKTLVVFTSDHGEEWLDHGRTFHGQSVYGEMNNMSLILRGPGIPKGAVVTPSVQVIDVMPTLLALGGLEPPKGLQGSSLLDLLDPTHAEDAVHAHGGVVHDWEDRPAISEKLETDGKSSGGSPPPRDTESVAIIQGGLKLIHNIKRPAGKPEFELYDHAQDPLDQQDLAAERPDAVLRLSKQLAAWRQRANAARLEPDSTEGVSAQELEKLRALGYVQ
jgi:arylsulfatase A-like enzyme